MRLLVGKPMKITVLRKDAAKEETIEAPAGGFEFEDTIHGTTDPKTPNEPSNVTPLDEAPPQLVGHTPHEDRDPFDYHRRMKLLKGKPVVLQVKRGKASTP